MWFYYLCNPEYPIIHVKLPLHLVEQMCWYLLNQSTSLFLWDLFHFVLFKLLDISCGWLSTKQISFLMHQSPLFFASICLFHNGVLHRCICTLQCQFVEPIKLHLPSAFLNYIYDYISNAKFMDTSAYQFCQDLCVLNMPDTTKSRYKSCQSMW